MKTLAWALLAGLICGAHSCHSSKSTVVTSEKARSAPVPAAPFDDLEYEILTRHLLHENQKLSETASEEQDQVIKHDNQCLENEIASLEGRPKPHRASVASASRILEAGLDRMIQQMLDSEASIAEHNRRHPDKPWEGVSDILLHFCGDCTKQRAERAAELRKEATVSEEHQPPTPKR